MIWRVASVLSLALIAIIVTSSACERNTGYEHIG